MNNSTGIISNPLKVELGKGEFWSVQRVEFSPDGKLLYAISHFFTIHPFDEYDKIIQYDLSTNNQDSIRNSYVTLNITRNVDYGYEYGALQIGPDCKIYIAQSRNRYLGVIHNPNQKGFGCFYDEYGVDLLQPLKTRHGLPNFINDYFTKCNCTSNPVNYPDFNNTKDIIFAGDAQKNDKSIVLTGTKIYQRGAAWNRNEIEVDRDFNLKFKFKITNPKNFGKDDGSSIGGDGLAFVFQYSNPFAFGMYGGGLGYSGIPNSLAVEFDLFNNNSGQIEDYNDPNGNHAAVQCAGTNPNSSTHNSKTTLAIADNIIPIKSDGTEYHVKIQYKKSSLQLCVFIDTTGAFKTPVIELDSFDLSKAISLKDGKKAFLGFTAGTGLSVQEQEILSWEMCYPEENIVPVLEVKDENEISRELDFPNMYPNPVTDWLIINPDWRTLSTNQNIDIISVEGINVLTVPAKSAINEGYIKIDVSGLFRGLYFVKIGNHVDKFMKI